MKDRILAKQRKGSRKVILFQFSRAHAQSRDWEIRFTYSGDLYLVNRRAPRVATLPVHVLLVPGLYAIRSSVQTEAPTDSRVGRGGDDATKLPRLPGSNRSLLVGQFSYNRSRT